MTERGGGAGSKKDPERLGPLVGRLFRRLGISAEVASQSALTRWEDIVGDGIAEVTRPRAVSNGVLFVEVASSAWLTELNLMRRDILARLNAGRTEGRVERIVFTLAERPPKGGAPEAR